MFIELKHWTKADLNMTRPAFTLKALFYHRVSIGALTMSCQPMIFAAQIDARYMGACETYHSNAPLSFLAWVQMWLRLALGLELGSTGAGRGFTNYNVPRISPRQVRVKNIRRAPAYNLEALMHFAPDCAGNGLTLNQYRERFTRLSVLGRLQIYRGIFKALGVILRSCGYQSDVKAAAQKRAICDAPLKPD